jgi:hypothetical protein
VQYSGLDYSPSADVTALNGVTMVQDGWGVSTPSDAGDLDTLLSDGFNTSYTGL